MKDFAKFFLTDLKYLLNFEHKLTLGFLLLTFIHAKWVKFKPTFVKSFCKI
jgi:hypothetical protein